MLAVLSLASCGKDSPTRPEPTPPPEPPAPSVPTRIDITPGNASLDAVGQTVQLAAAVFDQNGQAISAPVAWSSSDATVASVSATGLVTALKNGTAQITARAGNASASITVSISQNAVRIVIVPESAALDAIGQTVQLTATVYDRNGQAISAPAAWSSSDEAVASVSATGLVTALKNGTARITARAGNASASITVSISQNAVRIVIMPESAALDAIGQTVQLSAEVYDRNGQAISDPVAWSSSDEAVASVSETGLVTALTSGSVKITARAGAASARVEVTVGITVARVALAPETGSLTSEGETLQLAATVYDRNDTVIPEAAVAWSSSDEAVASVSETGLVTALSNGEARITAASGGQSASAQIMVMIPSPDRGPLAAIYHGLAGPDWLNSANWLTDAPVWEWHGVTADKKGRVTELDLSNNGLEGAVPAEVAGLGGLQKLNLAGNDRLSGILPRGMIRLALDELHLDDTDLCAPTDADFQAWLDRISDARVDTCDGVRLDRDALVAFYHATAGPDWTNNANWLTDASLDAWEGVETDPRGRVAQVYMLRNNLDGQIPPEIGRLGELDVLSLLESRLYGPVPIELVQLEKLRELRLHANDLSGLIPPELGDMTSLTSLDLGGNELTGPIPPELGRLKGLGRLSLKVNDLSGLIPPELGQLTRLQRLFLDGNAFTGAIPPELGELKELKLLWLSYNRLSGSIPSELGALEKLDNLALGFNRLTGPIPPELGRLRNLRRLHLSNNRLSGPIPSELGNIPFFEILDLSNNRNLSGPLPRTFLDTRIETLKLEGTGICIPADDEFLAWVGEIRTFDAAYCGDKVRDALVALYNRTDGQAWNNRLNWLSDRSPGEWHGVTVDARNRLIALELPDNNLNGSLPVLLSALTDLKRLDLSGNPGLSGPLHRSFLDFDLDVLDLDDTSLCVPGDSEFRAWLDGIGDSRAAFCTGQPRDFQALAAFYNATGGPGWSNSTNWLSNEPLSEWHGISTDAAGRVVELFLFENNLTGSIPPEIGLLDRLLTLQLYGNRLSGSIPPEIGRLHRLKWISFGQNELYGPIPPETGQLTDLEILFLSGNELSGPIPPEMGGLTRLKRLWLDGNQLTGSIPAEFGRLENLELVYLSVNTLTGLIPSQLGNLSKLQNLVAFSNKLTGPIPPELGNLTSLEILSLWDNRITGTIPAELGRLENLIGLYLNRNLLTGRIPSELGNLTGLIRMDLYENQLSGPIPRRFGSLAALRELSLNVNRLTGAVPAELGDLSGLKTLKLNGNAGLAGPLPLSFTQLDLEVLSVGGTALCAPQDTGFDVWLNSLPFARVPDCVPAEGPVLYLTQAVQSPISPVPLVAGDDALLRLFLTTDEGSGDGLPPVRATFFHEDAEVHSVEVSGATTPIPEEMDEGTLSASVNTPVPGWVIQPGLELVVLIDPDGTWETPGDIPSRVPPMGRMPVEVWEVPTFDLTLVPLLWEDDPDYSLQAEIEGLSPDDDLFWQTRDLLPVGEFDLSVRDPVMTSLEPVHENRLRLLNELEVIHLVDGGQGNYMGVLKGYGGLAGIGEPVFLSGLDGETIAHELGHAMNLAHTSCGGTGLLTIDASFPYEGGSIGVWGYDKRNHTLVHPGTKDMMGYCNPTWISDYHFVKAMRFRGSVDRAVSRSHADPAPGLLLWGSVDEFGTIELEPAFQVQATPALPAGPGPYRLTGEGPDGSTLFTMRFDMKRMDDGEGAYFAHFLPMREDMRNRLSSITLTGPEGVSVLDGREVRSAALLLDRHTGRARGILRDRDGPGSGPAATRRVLRDQGLDVVVIRSVPRVLPR